MIIRIIHSNHNLFNQLNIQIYYNIFKNLIFLEFLIFIEFQFLLKIIMIVFYLKNNFHDKILIIRYEILDVYIFILRILICKLIHFLLFFSVFERNLFFYNLISLKIELWWYFFERIKFYYLFWIVKWMQCIYYNILCIWFAFVSIVFIIVHELLNTFQWILSLWDFIHEYLIFILVKLSWNDNYN